MEEQNSNQLYFITRREKTLIKLVASKCTYDEIEKETGIKSVRINTIKRQVKARFKAKHTIHLMQILKNQNLI